MATTKAPATNQASAPKTNTRTISDALREEGAVPEGFVEVKSERHFYNDEKCAATAVQGALIGAVRMSSKTGDFTVFAIRLEKECLAVDRDGNTYTVPKGDVLYIRDKAKTREFFGPLLAEKSKVFSVWIRPEKKIDIGGGQTMWTYATAIGPVRERLAHEPVALDMRRDAQNTNLLPQGSAADGADDIPF